VWIWKEENWVPGFNNKNNWVEMDPVKVQGILDWPKPQPLKELQAFIGFCNFYRRFCEGFAEIAQPLHNLSRKDIDWDFTDECKQAVNQLKGKFTLAPVLVMPDTTKQMRIETDASDFAYRAILLQLEEDGLWHPVSYLSKSLTETERNYDIHDKELKAIIGALETWSHYLEGAQHKIEIWMDHKNLEYFKKNQNSADDKQDGCNFYRDLIIAWYINQESRTKQMDYPEG
jgi:hypothetical protein